MSVGRRIGKGSPKVKISRMAGTKVFTKVTSPVRGKGVKRTLGPAGPIQQSQAFSPVTDSRVLVAEDS